MQFAVSGFLSLRVKGKIRMEEFLEQVAEVLEVPSVQPGDAFRAVPMWGSLTGFALVVMIEQRYGRRLGPEDFKHLVTVADLASAAGVMA